MGGAKPGGMPGVEVPGLDPLSPSKGDFVDPCLGDLIWILKLPEWLKGLLAFVLKPLVRAQGVEGVGWVRGSFWGSSPSPQPLLAGMASYSKPPHPDSSPPPTPLVFSRPAC